LALLRVGIDEDLDIAALALEGAKERIRLEIPGGDKPLALGGRRLLRGVERLDEK
jgi:hypothetical protein